MKVAPTLEGGLRIDAEGSRDWEVLRMIVPDAVSRGSDLAARLCERMSAGEGGEDWAELVEPELRSLFDSQLAVVANAVEEAAAAAANAAGPLLIPRTAAETWYGALNQARLAIEERHQFHAPHAGGPEGMPPGRRSAWFRGQFYLAVQGLLLDHLLTR